MKGLKEALLALVVAVVITFIISLLLRPAEAIEWQLPTIEIGVGYDMHNTFGANPVGHIILQRCTVGDYCVGYLHNSSIPLYRDKAVTDMFYASKKWTIKSFWSK